MENVWNDYLKDLNTSKTADLLKKDKITYLDDGSIHSTDTSDYDPVSGRLKNAPKLYEEDKKRRNTIDAMQHSLNMLDIGDAENKPLKVDKVFGPKTQAAWNKYAAAYLPNEVNMLTDVASSLVQSKRNDTAHPKAMKGYDSTVASNTNIGIMGMTPQAFDPFNSSDEKSVERERRNLARTELNTILDRQYGWAKTVDFPINTVQTGVLGQPTPDYSVWQNTIGALADQRMNQVLDNIDKNRTHIKETAKEFGIPADIIGSIILKEQYTESLPDWMANILTPIGSAVPWLQNNAGKFFGTHSTGLGAIFPQYARQAWEGYLGKAKADELLPASDVQLQKKLSEDDAFSIRSIGVVLTSKAIELGLIQSYDEMNKLDEGAWRQVIMKYNGNADGPNGDKVRQYGEYVAEYIPYMKKYLD